MTDAERWDGAYTAGRPPWDLDAPQPVVVRIAAANGFSGRVLDAGCGTGENALYLASLGLDVTGIDWSGVAIERARERAAERRLSPTFEIVDATQIERLGRSFDSVLDCGLFHTFDDDDRRPYAAGLAAVLAPGGVLHLLCFSELEPWGGGPRRVTQQEIRRVFDEGWAVEDIEAERFATRFHDDGARAWHATIRRIAGSD